MSEQSKYQLRKKQLEILGNLTEHERAEISYALHNALTKAPVYKNAAIIGITLAQSHEWHTDLIIQEALNEGKKIVVPVCEPKTKTMIFYPLSSIDDVAPGHFNIREPIVDHVTPIDKDKIDLLIVPGLVFDEARYRIGHGGGYYDRFLATFSGVSLSLVWREQMVEHFEHEYFDEPVDQLIIVE